MHSKKTEFIVGIFIAAGIAALFMLAMKVSNLTDLGSGDGYTVTAEFDGIGGLKRGAKVSMAGVPVGRVTSIVLDPDSYSAKVTMMIDDQYNYLPLDTSASILTAGLLGENYIGLQAGGEEDYLTDGDAITLTQPALVLEKVIGQFLYSKAKGD